MARSGIFAEVLGVDQVGAEDNFFSLGGHSLLAMQVLLLILEKLEVELPVQTLFERPTVGAVSRFIASDGSGWAESPGPITTAIGPDRAALTGRSASSTNGDHSQEEIMTRAFVYRSRLRDWDSLASVRGGPRRLLEDEEAKGKVYFSTRLTPYVHHPLVVRLGPEAQRALVIHRLYHYLDFTANFEIEVVNRAAQRIAMGMTGFDLPAEMASDAYKIYCDEGYHSFFSIDLKLQVQAATGVTPLPYNFDRFLRRLYKASEKVPANLKPIASLLTVIVFETLISLILIGVTQLIRE